MPPPLRRLPRLLLLALALAAGCKSAGTFREEADDTAYAIIDSGQRDALGRTEPFTIDTPAQTFRNRLLAMQELATSHPASRGTAALQPLDPWPEDDYLERRRDLESPTAALRIPESSPVRLTLEEALRVGAADSRAYQEAKERVFRSALDLDLERDAFRSTLAGLVAEDLEHDAGAGTTELRQGGAFSIERRFLNGLSVSGRLFVDLVRLLNRSEESATGLLADVSVSLPLLAGSGRHIVGEPLTQAERDVLYALWEFERFKRTFVVGIASDYLAVLRRRDRVENAAGNYRRLIESLQRAQALHRAGRRPAVEVDQARQDVLSARNGWIVAREDHRRALDAFKLTLGLPTDARLELDPKALEDLAAIDVGAPDAGATGAETSLGIRRGPEGELVLTPPGRRGAGPLELEAPVAIEIALEHRLDLAVAQGRVRDAMRRQRVAGDDLRPGLTLLAGGTVGQRRGPGSAGLSDADFDPAEGRYNFGLELEMPWEKTAERNLYRQAIIDLEAQVRAMQETEDRIKLEIRNVLRDLREARASYRIQREAVAVARERVDSVNMFLRFGRAETRDLLEAERALLDAQNSLTDARVAYRVAELELQRDLGRLEVDHQGRWREYEPPTLER